MKKHIFGLGIFSFIVGTAAIIYAAFNAVNVEEVFVITNNQTSPAVKSCWKMKQNWGTSNDTSIKVNQAILNLQTKEFSWEIAAPGTAAPIALHFFSKDSGEMRYVTTETVNGKFSRNGLLRFSNTYQWLNRRKSFGNLYVIADFDLRFETHDEKYQPKFDSANATAVTFDYGEADYPTVGNVEIK